MVSVHPLLGDRGTQHLSLLYPLVILRFPWAQDLCWYFQAFLVRFRRLFLEYLT